MNKRRFILTILSIIFIFLGFTFYHDYVGLNASAQEKATSFKIPGPGPTLKSVGIVYNDFTFWKMNPVPAADLIMDDKLYNLSAFDSQTLPPTYNLSDPKKLISTQYAHMMVITIPHNLSNIYDNAQKIHLIVHYTNGMKRDLVIR